MERVTPEAGEGLRLDSLLSDVSPKGSGSSVEDPTRQANKGFLAESVADELGIPRRAATRVVGVVLNAVEDLLRHRGKVVVKGFGTFERKIRKGRAYKHPLTGETIPVADKQTITFKPSDRLVTATRAG